MFPREGPRAVTEQFDLVVRGGTIVTPDTLSEADIGIRDGQIVQIGGNMSAAEEIDAHDKLVIPGGVDMHVHLSPVESEDGPMPWADDFVSGSRAAAVGGITTLGNITFPRAGELPISLLERTAQVAARDSIVDFILHPVILDPSKEMLAEIPQLAAQGRTSIKIFMSFGGFDAKVEAYLEVMNAAGREGMLTMVHCEDGCIIAFLTRQLLATGRGDLSNYAASRPIYSEAVAVMRASALAQAAQAPIYIVHLSSEDALRVAREERARGVPLYVETRPMYLYFTREKFEGVDGPLYIGQPPLRDADDVRSLWFGLNTGTIQTCCTDHAAWTREQKLAPGLTIDRAPPGVADLETLMPILFSEGVRKDRISLHRFVEITSTNAAKLFGIFPRKGTIEVGSDADLVIWDPELSRVIHGDEGMSRAGYSLYEGWEVVGWPRYTISRGQVIVADGQVTAKSGRGRWLSQGPTMML
jgi:dihydropyrimidinase